ncbi:glycosyltransferase [Candidatus Bathyarchaeota archaeon]|nr:glycosyltransferase [Candidatus Bathyarchaeota archaeon]
MGLRGNMPDGLSEEVEFYEIGVPEAMIKPSNNMVLSALSFLLEQLIATLSIVMLSKRISFVLFSHCMMPIPMLISRILRKNVIVYMAGIPLPVNPKNNLSRRATSIVEDLCYRSANCVLVISSYLRKQYPLNKYSNKTFEAPLRICDKKFFTNFNYSTSSDRGNVVGFISRLSWEKGITEFVRSIPYVRSKRNDVTFLIVGDGPLRNQVLSEVSRLEASGRVAVIPWTDRVASYLRKLRLLVLPSRTEGIPSVILEAMACGTPVLVTPVGGLAGLFVDGRNGFLLNNTNPEYLARKILEILDRSDLDDITNNAYRLLHNSFGEGSVLKAWKHAFMVVFGNRV